MVGEVERDQRDGRTRRAGGGGEGVAELPLLLYTSSQWEEYLASHGARRSPFTAPRHRPINMARRAAVASARRRRGVEDRGGQR
jgi:hypothetical protein